MKLDRHVNRIRTAYQTRNAYQARNLKRINPILAIGIVVVVIGITGIARGFIENQVVILGAYACGVVATATAWYGTFRWKQTLWTIGMLCLGVSTAEMVLIAQYWLAVGAFFFFLVVILYPTIAKQTHEEVRNRRR